MKRETFPVWMDEATLKALLALRGKDGESLYQITFELVPKKAKKGRRT